MFSIVHIIREKDRGGITKIVFPLAKRLHARGFRIILIVLGKGHAAKEFSEELGGSKDNGISVITVDKKIGGFDPLLLIRLIKLTKNKHINLIHTHSIGSNFYGRLLGLILDIPVVTTVHADTLSTLKGVFRFNVIGLMIYYIDKLMHRYSVKLVVVSKAIGSILVRRKIDQSKIVLIYNGIEVEDGGKVGNLSLIKKELGIIDEKVVGIVGRLAPVKNHLLFLKCVQLLLQKDRKIKFIIAGEGRLRGDLERIAEEMEIKDHIIFTGWLNNMRQLYGIMDVCVLTSHMECMPVVLLEAMAGCVPVVATKVGGVPEVVEEGRTGYLVPPDDPQAIAGAVHSLLEDPGRRKEMGLRGRQIVKQRFSADVMADGFVRMYRELLNGQAKG